MADGRPGGIQVPSVFVGAIQLPTALFQGLLTQISSRAGVSAQEYFVDTGIIARA
jgi:hypothetical protein